MMSNTDNSTSSHRTQMMNENTKRNMKRNTAQISVDDHGTNIDALKQSILGIASLRNFQDVEKFVKYLKGLNKHISHLSTISYPLYNLLNEKGDWKWTKGHEKCLTTLKEKVKDVDSLHSHDPNLPLHLKCEATFCGIGATLYHVLQDGSQRIISHSSRLLNEKERAYAPIEQQACSIVFGVRKFRSLVMNRKFTLSANDRALKYIFGDHTNRSSVDAIRLEKWASLLSRLNYDIDYKAPRSEHISEMQGTERGKVCSKKLDPRNLLYNFQHQISSLPVSSDQLRVATAKDTVLQKVLRHLHTGKWPNEITSDAQPYYDKREEMSVEDGIILWGLRVVIPSSLQSVILSYLHEGHPGQMKMKALSLLHAWFPRINKCIENLVSSCVNCAENTASVLTDKCSWDFPKEPMDRIRLDIFGPFVDRNCLIITDTYSGWVEVKFISKFDIQVIIKILRTWFSQFGIPKQIVVPTNYHTEFICNDFTEFIMEYGICRITSPSYYDPSNNEADRCVRAVKKSLQSNNTEDVVHNLDSFLFTYRATPLASTGKSPSELFLGRKITTKSDLVIKKPTDKRKTVSVDEQRNVEYSFGDCVVVQKGDKCVSGTIMRKVDGNYYEVYAEGSILKTHEKKLALDDRSEKRLNTI